MKSPSLSPAQQKQLLIGILALLAVVVGYLFWIAPRQRVLTEATAQVRQLELQLDQTRQGLSQLLSVEQEIQRLSARFQMASTPKPPEQQLPELLEEITQTARRAQVRVVEQKPTADIASLAPGTSGYLELTVMTVVTGGYHQIGTFLDLLEQSSTLLRVREMGMAQDSNDLFRHRAFILFDAYLIPGAAQESRG